MIHQCFFREDQRPRLFTSGPYRPFGLEPEVNPSLLRNCPELTEPAARLQFLEFGAMLSLGRNMADDPDPWIGFTSYRQMDKTPFRFAAAEDVAAALTDVDAAAWLRLTFSYPVAVQAEEAHPGLVSFLVRMMHYARPGRLNLSWLEKTSGFFASYFVMRKPSFALFMGDWLGPALEFCGKALKAGGDPYLATSPKAASYALERVFCAWAATNGRRVREVTAPGGRVWTEGVANG